MDRIPIPNKPTPKDMEDILNAIMDEALGAPITDLDSAPTTAGNELSANQIAYFSNNLYININGTVFRIGLTAV